MILPFVRRFTAHWMSYRLTLINWISKYNEQRPHSGKHCYGKTPMQAFREAKYLALEKQIPSAELSDNNSQLTVVV